MSDATTIRARDWLRQFDINYRDSILTEHDDCGIVDIAAEDGWHLACLGDIQRERDCAVCRGPI